MTFTSRLARYKKELRNASAEAATQKTITSLSRKFTKFKKLIWKTMSAHKAQMELLVVGLDWHDMASHSEVLLLHGRLDYKSHIRQFLNYEY